MVAAEDEVGMLWLERPVVVLLVALCPLLLSGEISDSLWLVVVVVVVPLGVVVVVVADDDDDEDDDAALMLLLEWPLLKELSVGAWPEARILSQLSADLSWDLICLFSFWLTSCSMADILLSKC